MPKEVLSLAKSFDDVEEENNNVIVSKYKELDEKCEKALNKIKRRKANKNGKKQQK